MGRPKISMPLGERFGKLVVTGPFGMKAGHTSVLCKCDCGNTAELNCSNLRHGQAKSCGCNRINPELHNLNGRVFGKLTVLDDSRMKSNHRAALCRCECGVESDVYLNAMVEGRVVSCGCVKDSVLGAASLTHGKARRGKVTPEYKVWQEMKKRCQGIGHSHYHHYGGRGIKACDRWKSFDNFLADMGERPPGLSIDRIDNDGDYEPGNCRWATDLEQANNRRATPMVTHNGRTQSMADWARELGFKYWSLRNRIVNLGWSVEKAFSTPAVIGRNQFD